MKKTLVSFLVIAMMVVFSAAAFAAEEKNLATPTIKNFVELIPMENAQNDPEKVSTYIEIRNDVNDPRVGESITSQTIISTSRSSSVLSACLTSSAQVTLNSFCSNIILKRSRCSGLSSTNKTLFFDSFLLGLWMFLTMA